MRTRWTRRTSRVSVLLQEPSIRAVVLPTAVLHGRPHRGLASREAEPAVELATREPELRARRGHGTERTVGAVVVHGARLVRGARDRAEGGVRVVAVRVRARALPQQLVRPRSIHPPSATVAVRLEVPSHVRLRGAVPHYVKPAHRNMSNRKVRYQCKRRAAAHQAQQSGRVSLVPPSILSPGSTGVSRLIQ